MRPQPDPPPRPPRREPTERPSRLRGRGRIVLGVVFALVFFLLVSMRGIAAFYTDYLWFDSIGLRRLWTDVLTTKALLTFAGGMIFFILCWINLAIAERFAPVFRPSSGEDDLIERYHDVVGRRAWMVRLGISLVLALVVGVTLGSYWNEWILFKNRVDFGQQDETFGADIGFYVFQLPFLTGALSWLFSSLFVILVITVVAHIVNGGIRFHTQLDRVTPQVKAHISLMLAALALVQGGRYWLSRYQLTFSTRGTVDGATYTDVNVEQRALYLLMMIALFAFCLFIANIWRRGWRLPVMAVGLWVLVYVIAGTMVPALVQQVRVQPTESTRERPYIENNIAATRDAYGLGGVEEVRYEWTAGLDAEALGENMGTMSNVRLWNPGSMQASFRARQEFKSFYKVGDVDVDRYEIDGEERSVMLAARNLDPNGISRKSWEQSHLTYTHGWGVVAAPSSDKTVNGDPDLVVRNMDNTVSGGLPEIAEPRIYFGEDNSGYVIVNTDVRNSSDEEFEVTTYKGDDGIEIGSGVTGFLRKAAFSLRFGEVDPLVSGSLRPDSKVLLERDVKGRVEAIAPFLAYDHDPYLVMVDGRLQYVLDGYTTTANYPNAQRADKEGLDRSSGLYGRSFNYVRNSVKAVVDAYDGTITLYVYDEEDPLIQAYQKAFPNLFTPLSEADDELVEHFRYPEDLFTVQTQMWGSYHVDDPADFYNGRDGWEPPADTGGERRTNSGKTKLGTNGLKANPDDRYASQYLLMQLPGESEASFVVLRPYVTATEDDDDGGQNQLRAFMVANSEPGSGGKLTTYVMDASTLPEGPNLAAQDIQADGVVGDTMKSLCTEKSVCTLAPPTLVPVGNSILYVQSLLVSGSQNGAPRLERVIVNYVGPEDSQIAIDTTLRGALVELFGDEVPEGIEDAGNGSSSEPVATEPGEEPAEEETLSEQETRLIDEIVRLFDEADQAAADGDQVEWVTKVGEAGERAKELQELREQGQRAPAGEGAEGGGEPSDSEESGSSPNGDGGSPSDSTTSTTTVGT